MSFQSFSLDPRVLAGVDALGFTEPTPIQERSIPSLLEGHDLLGVAQTGTGKTAAFVLPILERLIGGPRGRLRALIIAPTRELAEQIHETVRALGRSSGLRSAVVYGGVGWVPQEKALRTCDILVACPGRLLAHIEARTVRLSSVEVLVLDEADRLFDMGFLPSIRRLLKELPSERQTMLFSATMPSEVRVLAREALRNPVSIEVAADAPAATVSHAIFPVSQGRKTALLSEILRSPDARSVIVFTRTKHRAKALARDLMSTGRKVTSMQGNLSQNERRHALEGFRRGQYDVLVATDIAARGIDVESVSHVINYDAPDTVDAYTHRIGRTGRATRTGEAFTLVTHEDMLLVRTLERMMGKSLERRMIEGFEDRFAPLANGAAKSGAVGNEFRSAPRRRSTGSAGRPSTGAGRPRRVWG